MDKVTWAEGVSAMGSIATPVVVAVVAIIFSRRQSRNDELLKARMAYYLELTPDLNVLMCYMTFIGDWRDISPPEVVALKRRLDRRFFCARPLFSDPVHDAYLDFSNKCFAIFGTWGDDARIRTTAYLRREVWRRDDPWRREWDTMFAKQDAEGVSAAELQEVRTAHDRLLAAFVKDLTLTRAKSEYTTSLVSFNEHAPQLHNVEGSEPSVT